MGAITFNDRKMQVVVTILYTNYILQLTSIKLDFDRIFFSYNQNNVDNFQHIYMKKHFKTGSQQ